jgi:hypothetical protein
MAALDLTEGFTSAYESKLPEAGAVGAWPIAL